MYQLAASFPPGWYTDEGLAPHVHYPPDHEGLDGIAILHSGAALDCLRFPGGLMVSRRWRDALAAPAGVVNYRPVRLAEGSAQAARDCDYQLLEVLHSTTLTVPPCAEDTPSGLLQSLEDELLSWVPEDQREELVAQMTRAAITVTSPIRRIPAVEVTTRITTDPNYPGFLWLSEAAVLDILRAGCTGAFFACPDRADLTPQTVYLTLDGYRRIVEADLATGQWVLEPAID